MKARFTGLWVVLALGLFAFIVWVERRMEEPVQGPRVLLPGWEPGRATAAEVHGPGRPLLRVERRDGRWWLVEPLVDLADERRLEALWQALGSEPVQTVMNRTELLTRPGVLQEFGLETPAVSLRVWSEDQLMQLQFGHRTAPGDQVFVQLVGADEIWVASSELLRLLPAQPEDWREHRWFRWPAVDLDRLMVSNRWGRFVLVRNRLGEGWSLVEPLRARADSDKVEGLWRELTGLEVAAFVADTPAADLELFGLQPPALSMVVFRDNRAVGRFDFGRPVTNRNDLVYARQEGRTAVVTLPAGPVQAWEVTHSEFRDRRLLRWREPVAAVEFLGEDSFAVHRLPGQWRLLPRDLPADEALVEAVLNQLEHLEISEFVKDVVIEPDLVRYGLAPPGRQIILHRAPSRTGDTNTVVGEVQLGTVQEDKVFVRRPDEPAVYAVAASEVAKLPRAYYQLRDRRIWRLAESQVASVSVQEGSRRRELVRHGEYAWTLAPGSEGIINSLAVGEAVHALCELEAVVWLGVGDEALSEYGFGHDAWSVTLRCTDGRELTVSFARPRPELPLLGMVRLEGQPWIFLTSPVVQELVLGYLRLPTSSVR